MRLAGALAVVACVLSAALLIGRTVAPFEPQAETTPTPIHAASPTAAAPTSAPVEPGSTGAATTLRATVVRSAPDTRAGVVSRLRAGVLVPVAGERPGFVHITTPCERGGWVLTRDVRLHERATAAARSLDEATIVIDAGHGGSQPGAVGPAGLDEKDPNLDIARRVTAHLGRARVFLTRDADYTAGIPFRDAVARAIGAHVLISIHNNAEPDGPSDRPGTETYYQINSPASKRLAGLLYEELVPALTPFPAAWVADRDAGAKYRPNAGGGDYYAILRGSSVPAVIVEALFISNASEEKLLARTDVREAAASAIARALDRYFRTNDPGSGFVTPYPREPGPSGRLPSTCMDPA